MQMKKSSEKCRDKGEVFFLPASYQFIASYNSKGDKSVSLRENWRPVIMFVDNQ